jgi:hypothetical protein
MQAETKNIFTNLFSQTPYTEASNEELQQLAKKYPYFAPAQFALTANLKHENNFNYLSQLQKTALFFSNHKWLEYLLTDEEEFDDFDISGNEEISASKISSVLSSQLTEIKKPVEEDAKLEFEKVLPQYAIDYFASQGITFDPTKINDKLSNQLMSFTDWLKQIKKTNPQLNQNTMSEEIENVIQKIAESSNETKEVVTETMAQVFIKQGNIEKARYLFSKLSLLYPEKSAYFAAKIQELNNK